MATYLRDFPSNVVLVEGISYNASATTVTGSSQNMITGDGRCTAHIQVSAMSSAATMVVYVEESTNGTSFSAVSPGGTMSITTSGVTAFSFDRTKQYLRSYFSITGSKTAIFGVTLFEQLKTY